MSQSACVCVCVCEVYQVQWYELVSHVRLCLCVCGGAVCRVDRVAAVLLQCAYELNRPSEAEVFQKYCEKVRPHTRVCRYARVCHLHVCVCVRNQHCPVPVPMVLLWTRYCIFRGRFEYSIRILRRLHESLEKVCCKLLCLCAMRVSLTCAHYQHT